MKDQNEFGLVAAHPFSLYVDVKCKGLQRVGYMGA